MQARPFESDESRGSEAPRPSRHLAVREHSLKALLELNREISVRFEMRQVVDLVLFNLMGHLGARQAALWLVDRSREDTLELVRGHGIPPAGANAVMAALRSSLERWSARALRPARIPDGELPLDPEGVAAVREAGWALIGPLHAHGEIIGFVALGPRADGDGSSDLDLDVFQSSLGVAGVAIQNSRLFHELEARNRSLAAAYRDLMELDKMKTEFLQNVNHELRTPLSIISGSVECLLEPSDTDPRRHQLVVAISNQAGKLGAMVQSLLDFTNLAIDDDASPVETVDLASFVERYVFERSARVAAARHTMRIGPLAQGTIVGMDPAHLNKALDLLLDNALKFTPEGCTITLTVSPDAESSSFASLAFADDGPGLPSEHIERLFRPFHQVDGSATRVAGGLGIGLALARRLLTSMDGSIDVESPAGGGTAFRIRLRRA